MNGFDCLIFIVLWIRIRNFLATTVNFFKFIPPGDFSFIFSKKVVQFKCFDYTVLSQRPSFHFISSLYTLQNSWVFCLPLAAFLLIIFYLCRNPFAGSLLPSGNPVPGGSNPNAVHPITGVPVNRLLPATGVLRLALPPPSVTQQQPILSSARIQQCRSPQPGPSGLQPPVSRGQKILQLSLAQRRNHNDSDSDLEHDEQLEDDDFYDSIQSIAEDDHEVEGMELYSTETTIVIGEVGTKVNYFFCSQQWIRWIRIGILLSSCKKLKKN